MNELKDFVSKVNGTFEYVPEEVKLTPVQIQYKRLIYSTTEQIR